MIITVKNLHQQTFTVEFDSKNTVFQLKEKIYNDRGSEYVVEKQKLIYAGVVLDDERTIDSYNVDEKGFIVVMLKRDIGSYDQRPDNRGTLSGLSNPTKALDEKRQKNAGNHDQGNTDEDKKSVGSGDSDSSGERNTLEPVGSHSSILSIESGTSVHSESSVGSRSSETSHSTFSSGDLAGVFSITSLQSQAESNLLMGEEYCHTIESMIEMGYSREMVECAMAASYNNPERAVEYLVSGMPDTPNNFTSATSESILFRQFNIDTENADNDVGITEGRRGVLIHADVGSDRPIRPSGGSGNNLMRGYGDFSEEQSSTLHNTFGSHEEDPFEFLRNQPQFLQMRSLVYQNPDLLHAVLQQIGQTNPALLQLISENQDAFLSMLNQPMEGQSGLNSLNSRRMTVGRRVQLAASARVDAGGDGLHIRSLDTAHGGDGDGPIQRQRPGESGDAGADTIPYNILSPPDRSVERRTTAVGTFMRERAAAVEAVAALTDATATTLESDTVTVDDALGNDNFSTLASTTNVQRDAGDVYDARGNHYLPTLASSDEIIESEGIISIRLSQQDQDAIERLKALGFPENLVLQAYFACEKDEQLAANFLISSCNDE